MKIKNLHLQFQPKDDRAMLVDHGQEPKLAWDCHEEFLYCVAVWGLRGSIKAPKRNILERLLNKCGLRMVQASQVREIVTKQGTLRVTVEHAV